MSYRINGPTTIGDTGQLNVILGNVTLTDVGTAQGTVYYSSAAGNLFALPPGTSGQFLQTQGPAANPIWASTGFVPDSSFSASKVAGDSFNNVPTIVANWSTAGAQFFNTGQFNTTTGLFTPTVTGKYSIDATVQYMNMGAGGNSGMRVLEFYDNTGASVLLSKSLQPTSDVNANQNISIDDVINLTAGSSYGLRFYRTNAAGVNTLQTTSFFAIFRLK